MVSDLMTPVSFSSLFRSSASLKKALHRRAITKAVVVAGATIVASSIPRSLRRAGTKASCTMSIP